MTLPLLGGPIEVGLGPDHPLLSLVDIKEGFLPRNTRSQSSKTETTADGSRTERNTTVVQSIADITRCSPAILQRQPNDHPVVLWCGAFLPPSAFDILSRIQFIEFHAQLANGRECRSAAYFRGYFPVRVTLSTEHNSCCSLLGRPRSSASQRHLIILECTPRANITCNSN
jgi:hypothetical protein